MKIKYKSTSFEFDYDDSNEREGHPNFKDEANKKCDLLLSLAKKDAETMTAFQILANEAKAKGQI